MRELAALTLCMLGWVLLALFVRKCCQAPPLPPRHTALFTTGGILCLLLAALALAGMRDGFFLWLFSAPVAVMGLALGKGLLVKRPRR
ncbi:hypothetical protein [Oecophyllibacter saccharovorans]|uniref:hypothetical protein n=1 Tax=Oecophyllibacter saccharovorans TaxID=2558360 RepID=UPI001170E888|nr:hypothetical protein [Oecophyllibacter saccharovorans]TPW36717.1 hypothetical protein E3203_02925 [Oecophyllibacter saccharovorans]